MSEGTVFLIVAYAMFPAILIFAVTAKVWEMRRFRHWQPAEGTVLAVGVNARKNEPGDPAYNFHSTEVSNEPRVDYEYRIGTRTYRGSRIAFDGKSTGYRVARYLERYPVGGAVTVYYNPADPGEAVLEKAIAASTFAAMGIALLLALGVPLLGLYYYNHCVGWIRPYVARTDATRTVAASGTFGLLALLYAIGASAYVRRACRWPVAPGRVVVSKVEAFQHSNQDGPPSTRYKPAVLYTYTVDGLEYAGDRVGYGLIASGYSEVAARKIAERYPVGMVVNVHYDPKNAGDSMLNPRARWHYVPWVIAIGCLTLTWLSATG